MAEETIAEYMTRVTAELHAVEVSEMVPKMDLYLTPIMAMTVAAFVTEKYGIPVNVNGPVTLRSFIVQVEAIAAKPDLAHN